jgi:hypothetical protein
VNDLVQNLIKNEKLELSDKARIDLLTGKVDARLVYVLWILLQKHRISVSMIKTGHPLGPTTPGGYPNSHYYYRAIDITAVDDVPILHHGASLFIVDIGRMLRKLLCQQRPDCIFGPAEWQDALGYPATTGFKNDDFHNRIHTDHLHLSFELEVGNENQE